MLKGVLSWRRGRSHLRGKPVRNDLPLRSAMGCRNHREADPRLWLGSEDVDQNIDIAGPSENLLYRNVFVVLSNKCKG